MSKLRWTLSLLVGVTTLSVAQGAERAPSRGAEMRPAASPPPLPVAEDVSRRPHGPYDGQAGTSATTSQYAEAVIEHANPGMVSAEIGTTDGMVRGIPLVFVDEGVDIVRSANDGRGGRWNPPASRGSAVGRADLRNWTQFLDGRHEWYLRITDRSGQGGVLKSFTVVTSGGSQQIRQVPTTFAGNRMTEARLTPLAATTYVPVTPTYPGSYNPPYGNGYQPPYTGYQPPYTGYQPPYNTGVVPPYNTGYVGPYDSGSPYGTGYVPSYGSPYGSTYGSSMVTARMPRAASFGNLTAIDIDVNLSGGPYRRLGVVWELPAGWRIAQLQPSSVQSDSTSNKAVWRIDNPPAQLHLRVLAQAPQGYPGAGDVYEMDGSWKVDGSPILPIAGDNQILVGVGAGHDNDRHGFHPAPRSANEGILRRMTGQ